MTRWMYWNTYAAGTRERTRSASASLHQVRDAVASSLIEARLCGPPIGWNYAGPVFNRRGADEPCLDSTAVLVQTTRPPLTDPEPEEKEVRRAIERSRTELEKRLHDALKGFFARLERDHMQLTEALADLLPNQFSNRANIQFFTFGDGARYKGFVTPGGAKAARPPADAQQTAAFIVWLPHIGLDKPGFLAVFGMGGLETMILAKLVAHEYPDLLPTLVSAEHAVFAMLEVTPGQYPDEATADLGFAATWRCQPLIYTESEATLPPFDRFANRGDWPARRPMRKVNISDGTTPDAS